MAQKGGIAGKWIAFLLGFGAAAGGGYLVKDQEGQPIISRLIGSTTDNQGTSQQPAGSDAAKVEPEKPAPAAQATAPQVEETAGLAFDVLRVEKDGSVVIAGRGPASAMIEAIEGDAVLAGAQSGPGGDFAIVFDTPLAPGDHVIALRATGADGTVTVSGETAIVNIPASGGEVLAMVSKEGEATRLIQKPETAEPAAQQPAAEQPAATTAEPAPEAQPAQPPVPPVLVQAVDVEDARIFVAGTGAPGHGVGIYIDNVFKGTTTIGEEGAFLFELGETLSPGKHDLRVDMMEAGSSAVVSRAEVVVEHDVQQQVAAAEPAQPAAEQAISQPAAEPAQGQAATAEPAQPAAEQAASQPAAEPAQGQAATAEPAQPAASAASEPAQAPASGSEGAASQATQASAPEAAAPGSTAAETSAQAGTTSKPAGEPSGEQAGGTSIGGGSEASVAMSGQVVKPEGEAAPVIKTGNSIIIRRGDNLWRVSRRTYGLGRMYTIIYDANQGQIRNPDLIYPGQVLELPEMDK